MKTITTTVTVYKFNELSEEAQKKAIQTHWNINAPSNWWKSIYEDAEKVDIKINDFRLLNTGNYCNITITNCLKTANLITANHYEETATHTTAKNYIDDYNDLIKEYSDGVNTDKVTEENEGMFKGEISILDKYFEIDTANNYRDLLIEEYKYLISKEAVIETIQANDYDFTEDGNLYSNL